MNNAHYECTLRALRAGKHVLCEKPIASNLIQARTMFAEAKNANRFLMEVCLHLRIPIYRLLMCSNLLGLLEPVFPSVERIASNY